MSNTADSILLDGKDNGHDGGDDVNGSRDDDSAGEEGEKGEGEELEEEREGGPANEEEVEAEEADAEEEGGNRPFCIAKGKARDQNAILESYVSGFKDLGGNAAYNACILRSSDHSDKSSIFS